eukprot:836932_1
MSSNTNASESSVIENLLRDAGVYDSWVDTDSLILPILSKGCLLNYPFNISCMTRIEDEPYARNLEQKSVMDVINALKKSNHNQQDLVNGYARENTPTKVIPRDVMAFIANAFYVPECISVLRSKALSLIATCATSNRNNEDFQYWADHGLIDILKETEEKSLSFCIKSKIVVVLCKIAKHCNCQQLRDEILNKTLYQCMKAFRIYGERCINGREPLVDDDILSHLKPLVPHLLEIIKFEQNSTNLHIQYESLRIISIIIIALNKIRLIGRPANDWDYLYQSPFYQVLLGLLVHSPFYQIQEQVFFVLGNMFESRSRRHSLLSLDSDLLLNISRICCATFHAHSHLIGVLKPMSRVLLCLSSRDLVHQLGTLGLLDLLKSLYSLWNRVVNVPSQLISRKDDIRDILLNICTSFLHLTTHDRNDSNEEADRYVFQKTFASLEANGILKQFTQWICSFDSKNCDVGIRVIIAVAGIFSNINRVCNNFGFGDKLAQILKIYYDLLTIQLQETHVSPSTPPICDSIIDIALISLENRLIVIQSGLVEILFQLLDVGDSCPTYPEALSVIAAISCQPKNERIIQTYIGLDALGKHVDFLRNRTQARPLYIQAALESIEAILIWNVQLNDETIASLLAFMKNEGFRIYEERCFDWYDMYNYQQNDEIAGFALTPLRFQRLVNQIIHCCYNYQKHKICIRLY